MGFFSRILGFDRSRGAVNAVLADYMFNTLSVEDRRRVADEVVNIIGSVQKNKSKYEIAQDISEYIRVIQCNFLALAFDNLGISPPGNNAWWRVSNPFVETVRIDDGFLEVTADVVRRDDGIPVKWAGNDKKINFVAACGLGGVR